MCCAGCLWCGNKEFARRDGVYACTQTNISLFSRALNRSTRADQFAIAARSSSTLSTSLPPSPSPSLSTTMSNTSVSSSVTATFSQVQGSSSHGSTTVRKRTGTTPVLDEGNSSWSPSSVYEEAHEGRETTLTDRGRTIATTTVSDDEDEDDSEGPTIRFVERTKIAQAQSISWATTTSTTHSSTFPMPLPTELDTASLHHSEFVHLLLSLPFLYSLPLSLQH